MKTFLKIDSTLLANVNYTPTEKLFIAYLQSYQNDNKYCFDTQEELSKVFGICLRNIKYLIKDLRERGIIFMVPKSQIDHKSQYKNRKAIILVDDNNPLPTHMSNEKTKDEQSINSELKVYLPSREALLAYVHEDKTWTQIGYNLIGLSMANLKQDIRDRKIKSYMEINERAKIKPKIIFTKIQAFSKS